MRIELENKRTLLTATTFSELMGTEMSYIQSPILLELNGIQRLYFCSRVVSEQVNGNYFSHIYYVDFNETFSKIVGYSTKPIIGLGAIGTFDEHGTNPISAIKFRNMIFIYYVGWARSTDVPYAANIGLLRATDPEGSHFERAFPGPVMPFDRDEPFLLGSPRVKEFNGTLYMWYVAGKSWDVINGRPEPTYKIRMATSTNGSHWSKIKKDLIGNTLGEFECQAAPEVIQLEEGFLMIYSYRSNAREGSDSDYQVNLAYSDDLLNWKVETLENSRSYISPNMRNTSYYNLVPDEGCFRATFQLENMGKTGIGCGLLRVSEKK